MKILASLFAFTMMTVSAFADTSVLDLNAANESDYGVKLAISAKENVTGMNQTLALSGEGMRAKRVAGIPIKVYVTQFFAEHPEAMDRTEEGAMKSMPSLGTVAIRLTFLRTVDANTVQVSFKEALNANEIDPTSKDLAQFLAAVKNGGDATYGTSLTIVGSKKSDGTEMITYEDSAGVRTDVVGSAGFVNQIMSIWFGESADSGLENLKARLLTQPRVTPAVR